MPECPWCDLGFVGDIRSACEKGHLLHPLARREHAVGCVVNLIVRERGVDGTELWFTQVERYVQGYVAKESFEA